MRCHPTVLAQPRGKTLAFRDLVEVRDVPDLARLLGQRRHQMRVVVAEAGDGDAAGEVEEAPAIGRVQVGAVAPLEGGATGVLTGAHDRATLAAAPHTHLLDSIVELPDLIAAAN